MQPLVQPFVQPLEQLLVQPVSPLRSQVQRSAEFVEVSTFRAMCRVLSAVQNEQEPRARGQPKQLEPNPELNLLALLPEASAPKFA